nr:hypothetical protein [Tanacetum cinerariifolium]
MRQAGIDIDFFTIASVLKVIGATLAVEVVLSGYAQHGYGKEIVEAFEQMTKTKVKPEMTTFLIVLSACSHVGWLDKAEHYACIVDLYARAGYLNKAKEVINSMPMEAGPSVYRALLSTCRVHENNEIGVRVARKIVDHSIHELAAYVQLSYILANNGYWDDSAKAHSLMCDKGIKEKTSCSWILAISVAVMKELKEVWFTICDDHKFFQDFLNTSESSNDNTNVVNAPQEPFVFNQDPSENSSHSPPHIDHHCCYGCGDSLDGIFCQRSTCESCRNGAHYGYNYPSKVSIISNLEPFHNQNVDEINDSMIELRETFQAWLPQQVGNLDSYSSDPSQYQKIPIYYDDDDDEESSTPLRDISISELPPCIAITPVLSTEDPKDSLIMEDKHLDPILEKESDKFIKSSIKNLVPNPRIDDADCDPEEEILLIEKLLYDISSPRPLGECNSENLDVIIKSFSPSPILVKDSDPLIEEIDLSLTPDDSMPPGIKNNDYDSEGDILILEELLGNDSLSLPQNKSFHFDIPSSPRPPAKPPDDDEIEPDSGSLTVKVVGDISEHYVLMPRILPTQPTLASNEEKSPHLLYHRGFKAC